MTSIAQGQPFHGEFTSTDATELSETGQRFTMYRSQGATVKTAVTLAANEQVVITDIFLHCELAMTVWVFDGANNTPNNGESILRSSFAINSGCGFQLNVPHYCLQGTYPKLKTSTAAKIDAIIRGFIVKN